MINLHTSSTLVKLLELERGNTNDRKRIVESLPKELTNINGETIKRELLLSEAVSRTGLIPIEIYNTVVEGSKPFVCFRNALPITGMNTDSLQVPYGDAGVYADIVAEGANFPAYYQNYTYLGLTAKKFGYTVPVSQEMVDDAKFGLIEIELKKGAAAVENKLNRYILGKMLDGAGLEHDTAGSNQGILAAISAKTLVLKEGFMPDKFVMAPDFWGKIMADYKPAYNEPAEATLRSGMPPSLVGLDPMMCSTLSDSATYTWAYASDGNIGGLVFDSLHGGIIGMRQDISVKMAEDPFKMLVSPLIYARFDGGVVQSDAICRIEY
jgi:HK97 family phage major capsid protein